MPLNVGPRWEGRSAAGRYGDAVECLDWSCGQVLDALERLGLRDRTLVVYCSDNGRWLSKAPDAGSAAPLRGGKGQTLDCGVRVPCIMRWPSRLPAGRVCREVAGLIDLLPSFAALAQAELPRDRVLDGRNIWPLMSGAPDARSPHEHFYFFRRGSVVAVRSGRWKLHRAAAPDTPAQLYDLRSDPGEREDAIASHPELAARLAAAAERFEAELAAERRPPGVEAEKQATGSPG